MTKLHVSWFHAILSRFCREKQEPVRDEALYALIETAKKDIAAYRRNLMFADSEALTDMYIYAIKASEMRYEHLLRMAKRTCEHSA